MWARFRKWKHAVAPWLIIYGGILMTIFDEGSALAVVTVMLWLFVYVVEEIVWIVHGKGRPCPACGHRVQMKAFRIHDGTCPNCGKDL